MSIRFFVDLSSQTGRKQTPAGPITPGGPDIMQPLFRNFMAGLASASALLLVACGGGGGGDETTTVITPPSAVATADASSVNIGTAVTLDGSASTTPNGGSLSYEWSLSTVPDGSTATLSSTTDAKPTFTPDRPGNYVATLQVVDSKASATATVRIAATTDVPVAIVANATQSVTRGTTVTLDGSGSVAPTGALAGSLTYQWTLTERPDGDASSLSNATRAVATFLPTTVGIFRASLVVSQGEKVSEAALATITVGSTNSAPVISLSYPTTIERGQTVVLDGSGTTDADGDTLHYRWAFPAYRDNSALVKPYGSTAPLSNANTARATFVPDAVGTYYIDFTVYDDNIAATQRISIVVTQPAGAVNTAPVAVIGPVTGVFECEIAAYCSATSTRSYDVDGDTLKRKWTYWNTATPENQFTVTDNNALVLTSNTAATYQVQLVVSDGVQESVAASATYTIKTGANRAPVASGVTTTLSRVMVGDSIRFTGTGTDGNGDRLDYLWTLVDRPDGSTATLQNAGTASSEPYVVADKPGLYAIQMQLRDSNGGVSTVANAPSNASVFAKRVNQAPVASSLKINGSSVAGKTDQPFILSASDGAVYLQGTTATYFDPDLDSPLFYTFTITRQPAGSQLTDHSSQDSITATDGTKTAYYSASTSQTKTVGDYEMQFMVSDYIAYSDTQTATFSVVGRANYPSLLLESGVSPAVTQKFFPLESTSRHSGATDLVNARTFSLQPSTATTPSSISRRGRQPAAARQHRRSADYRMVKSSGEGKP